MTARRPVALLAAVLLLAGLVGARPASAAEACGTGSSPTAGLVREAHPVVLAHGWTGAAMSQTRTALEAKIGRGWQFLLFDYHDASASWASSPRIAGCFATYLKAVSDTHLKAGGDGLVYVVAHSMGGLALRFAVDPRFGKVAGLGDRIGGLVSLATPHRGSPWGESGVYTQLVNLKNTLLIDAVPKGQEAARCLALHDAGKGLPAGCDPPPYLPAKIRVDQVAGVATVRRSFFGVHAYDILLGGDSIVPQDSAQGYLGSAAGSTAGRSTRLTQVPCAMDWDDFGAVLGGGVLGTIARLKIDGAAMDAIQGERTSPALLEFLAAANILMPCSHIGITTFDDAIDQTIRALRADVPAPGWAASLSLDNAVLPAGVCRPDAGPVQLRNGDGTSSAPSAADDWGGDATFYVHLMGVQAAGDLDGDGRSDLAVGVSCRGYGGGNNRFPHVLVLRGTPEAPSVAADAQPFGRAGEVKRLNISGGVLRADTSLFRDSDADCCPTGHGTSQWRWRGSELQSIGTRSHHPANDDLTYRHELRCGPVRAQGQILYVFSVSCADAKQAISGYTGTSRDQHALAGWSCMGTQNGSIDCTPGSAVTFKNEEQFLTSPHVRAVDPGGSPIPTS